MGLAASQARFLMLTARLSNLEYDGQQINQARSELADKTARAAAEYQNAMTNRRLLFDPLRQAYNDKNNYQVFTYDTIVNSIDEGGLGMRLVDENGKIIVPHLPSGVEETTAEANKYVVDENVYDSHYLEYNLRNSGWNLQKPTNQTKTSWTDYDLINVYAERTGLDIDKVDKNSNSYKSFLEHFTDLFSNREDNALKLRLTKDGQEVVADIGLARTAKPIVDTELTTQTDIESYIESKGYKIQLGKVTTYEAGWVNTDWTSTEGIFDVLDKTDDGEAEAIYTEKVSKYQAQDKKLEIRQKQIDAEHSAAQTEYDAVKKIVDKNVETTFKVFG